MRQEELDTILIHLKILSRLKANERIASHDGMVSLDPSRIAQPMMRWLRGETRDKNLNMIHTLIENGIHATRLLEAQRGDATTHATRERLGMDVKRLATSLTNAQKGLANLKATYNADATVQARLDIYIEKIGTCLQENCLSAQESAHPTIPIAWGASGGTTGQDEDVAEVETIETISSDVL